MSPVIFAIVKVPSPAAAQGTNDIRAIKAPVNIPNYWIWGVLFLVLLAATAAVIWYLRWRKSRPVPVVPQVVIPPHLRALRKLEEARALMEQPKPFTISVSDTIRLYLEERFDFHAPERTTEEFLNELQSTNLLSDSQKNSLADFLSRCDLVKFARYEPGPPELQDLFDSAVRLVQETRPAIAPPSESPNSVPESATA